MQLNLPADEVTVMGELINCHHLGNGKFVLSLAEPTVKSEGVKRVVVRVAGRIFYEADMWDETTFKDMVRIYDLEGEASYVVWDGSASGIRHLSATLFQDLRKDWYKAWTTDPDQFIEGDGVHIAITITPLKRL